MRHIGYRYEDREGHQFLICADRCWYGLGMDAKRACEIVWDEGLELRCDRCGRYLDARKRPEYIAAEVSRRILA